MPQPTPPSAHIRIAQELDLPPGHVQAALALFVDGATVPFIARYRKEATGGLDELQLRQIDERRTYLEALESRRSAIAKELESQGVLSDTLRAALARAGTKAELEDIYQPYKKKRRTRAATARERGLGPLADLMWRQADEGPSAARRFVSPDRDVPDAQSALAGARDICAEQLADKPELRSRLRESFAQHARIKVKKTSKFKKERTKFDDYETYDARSQGLPSHRVLAIERGEKEGVLQAKVEIELERHHHFAERLIPLRRGSRFQQELQEVIVDALKRLAAPSAASECRGELRKGAESEAVSVFARNLRELLMAAPFGEQAVLGIDPGQRTGCKCAAIDGQGNYLENDVLYLVQGEQKQAQAKATLLALIARHRIRAVAIGNGTHGRETLTFVQDALKGANLDNGPVPVSVSESGASIYSASDEARQEFPNLDLTVRGAISIARRLQDPLSELVKLDPKTIGVGQYQHDVNQGLLAERLQDVVESCVNLVGVDLNTASAKLLSFVSGIGPKLAEEMVNYRAAQGRFTGRRQLLKVKGLGPKAFEQSAGFLRIFGGKYPLDGSGVHPERYKLVEQMARDVGVPLQALVGSAEQVSKLQLDRYHQDDVGDFTLQDIASELKKPGRDPRRTFEAPSFRAGVNALEDLKEGMWLSGVVTNVTAFGAFVDVGVHQDGLVHVSQLADRFIRDPSEVAHVGQNIKVQVMSVDLQRKRISLSAKGQQQSA